MSSIDDSFSSLPLEHVGRPGSRLHAVNWEGLVGFVEWLFGLPSGPKYLAEHLGDSGLETKNHEVERLVQGFSGIPRVWGEGFVGLQG